jgi:signal transduction histidine kinase
MSAGPERRPGPGAPASADDARTRRLARRADYPARLDHKLRTNLSVIEGWAELLEDEDPTPEEQRAAVNAIRRNSAALIEHVRGLLVEQRLEAQADALVATPVDVAAVATSSSSTMRTRPPGSAFVSIGGPPSHAPAPLLKRRGDRI